MELIGTFMYSLHTGLLAYYMFQENLAIDLINKI
jgi:hypothetical protein